MHNYAQLRTTTHNCAQLRTTTHNYAQLRTTTHNCAQLRTTAHNYAQLRTTTHNYAQLRTMVAFIVVSIQFVFMVLGVSYSRVGFFITIIGMILYFKHIIHIDDFPLNGHPPSPKCESTKCRLWNFVRWMSSLIHLLADRNMLIVISAHLSAFIIDF